MQNEADIERVMRGTGMDRMQAIYHLKGRAQAQLYKQGRAQRAIAAVEPARAYLTAADQVRDAAEEMLHALKWIADNTAAGSAVRDVALGAIAKATGE